MSIYLKLGQKIYNRNKFSDYRRMVVFVIRSLRNNKNMEKLQSFFSETTLRTDFVNTHPYIFEQVTRCIFYNRSTFAERSFLIQEHVLFFEKKFTHDALKTMYLGTGIPLWNSDYHEKLLSLELCFDDGHKKEGLIAITLKLDTQQIYQIIFWVSPDKDGEIAMWVGALQGSLDGLDITRELTRHFSGYRPKNLVTQALRSIASKLGINKIYAVSNHGFYANNHIRLNRKLKTSLDDFWQETGGDVCNDKRFYLLPNIEPRKSLDEVQSKKRNLYRKRFAAIDIIDTTIKESLEIHLQKK